MAGLVGVGGVLDSRRVLTGISGMFYIGGVLDMLDGVRYPGFSLLCLQQDQFGSLGGWLPKRPRVAANGSFCQQLQALSGLVVGSPEAQRDPRAAKVCPRSRNSGTVGDALT